MKARIALTLGAMTFTGLWTPNNKLKIGFQKLCGSQSLDCCVTRLKTILHNNQSWVWPFLSRLFLQIKETSK